MGRLSQTATSLKWQSISLILPSPSQLSWESPNRRSVPSPVPSTVCLSRCTLMEDELFRNWKVTNSSKQRKGSACTVSPFHLRRSQHSLQISSFSCRAETFGGCRFIAAGSFDTCYFPEYGTHSWGKRAKEGRASCATEKAQVFHSFLDQFWFMSKFHRFHTVDRNCSKIISSYCC